MVVWLAVLDGRLVGRSTIVCWWTDGWNCVMVRGVVVVDVDVYVSREQKRMESHIVDEIAVLWDVFMSLFVHAWDVIDFLNGTT